MKKFSVPLIILLGLLATPAFSADLKVGEPAPDFSAPSTTGQSLGLKEFLGKTTVLYFYPKDDTPGCTIEAKGFKDLYPQFKALDVQVVGVSYDSLASHQAFQKSYDLPFPLIADTDRQVAKAYGVDQPFFAERDTFVISPKGKLIAIFRDVNPSGHAQEVLDWVKKYQSNP